MASLRTDGTALPRPTLDKMQLGLGAGYRLYNTADDEWVCLALVKDEHWTAFAEAIGNPEVANTRGTSGRHELEAAIEPWFASRTAEEAWKALDAVGVPCEIASEQFAYGPGGVHDDPEMLTRGYVVKQQHPKVGRFEHFGTTITFSGTPTSIFGPPPVCGQHTREVLVENGFSDAEVDAMLGSGALFEDLWVD
jgi:crotonobetainyl-CoA:carnitine CoA-transferase CaiB-like acyl-CoA transferase